MLQSNISSNTLVEVLLEVLCEMHSDVLKTLHVCVRCSFHRDPKTFIVLSLLTCTARLCTIIMCLTLTFIPVGCC